MDYPEKVRAVYDRHATKVGSFFVHNGADLLKAGSEVPRPTQGDRWGNWRYDRKRLVLEYAPADRHWWYEVDLEEMQSGLEMLDWILSISRKNSFCVSRKDIGDLVKALDDLRGAKAFPFKWRGV